MSTGKYSNYFYGKPQLKTVNFQEEKEKKQSVTP